MYLKAQCLKDKFSYIVERTMNLNSKEHKRKGYLIWRDLHSLVYITKGEMNFPKQHFLFFPSWLWEDTCLQVWSHDTVRNYSYLLLRYYHTYVSCICTLSGIWYEITFSQIVHSHSIQLEFFLDIILTHYLNNLSHNIYST